MNPRELRRGEVRRTESPGMKIKTVKRLILTLQSVFFPPFFFSTTTSDTDRIARLVKNFYNYVLTFFSDSQNCNSVFVLFRIKIPISINNITAVKKTTLKNIIKYFIVCAMTSNLYFFYFRTFIFIFILHIRFILIYIYFLRTFLLYNIFIAINKLV